MALAFDVKTKKQLRVIIDTDTACEADYPFAIVHALMSPKLNVKAIFAEQFGDSQTTKRSYDEIQKIVSLMSLNTPVYMGAGGSLNVVKDQPLSPASDFLIKEAMREDPMPLFVLCIGAITNVAASLQVSPEIASRMTIVWIGGHAYNNSEYANWTKGENWSLGDSPAVGVALDENCGDYEYREAPIINDDTSYTFENGRRLIRVYKSIDSRYILEDFMAKLELLYYME